MQLISLTASFSLTGQKLGLHLNDWNVILQIDPGLQAHVDGTLRVGDRIVGVNDMSADGILLKDLIRGLDRVLFIVARRVIVTPEESGPPVSIDAAAAPAAAEAAAEAEGVDPSPSEAKNSSAGRGDAVADGGKDAFTNLQAEASKRMRSIQGAFASNVVTPLSAIAAPGGTNAPPLADGAGGGALGAAALRQQQENRASPRGRR